MDFEPSGRPFIFGSPCPVRLLGTILALWWCFASVRRLKINGSLLQRTIAPSTVALHGNLKGRSCVREFKICRSQLGIYWLLFDFLSMNVNFEEPGGSRLCRRNLTAASPFPDDHSSAVAKPRSIRRVPTCGGPTCDTKRQLGGPWIVGRSRTGASADANRNVRLKNDRRRPSSRGVDVPQGAGCDRWLRCRGMTYEDLIDLARICLRRAEAAANPQTATELRNMAQEYGQRAAAMTGSDRSAAGDQSQCGKIDSGTRYGTS
jgi:hypothetical protein